MVLRGEVKSPTNAAPQSNHSTPPRQAEVSSLYAFRHIVWLDAHRIIRNGVSLRFLEARLDILRIIDNNARYYVDYLTVDICMYPILLVLQNP